MSDRIEPAPKGRTAARVFNPPRVVPLRPRGVHASPPEGDRPSADPAASGPTSFATTSLELASYLLASGHRIARITGPRTRRRVVFEDVSQAARLAYYNGATAPARQLFEAWHSLRHGLMNLLD